MSTFYKTDYGTLKNELAFALLLHSRWGGRAKLPCGCLNHLAARKGKKKKQPTQDKHMLSFQKKQVPVPLQYMYMLYRKQRLMNVSVCMKCQSSVSLMLKLLLNEDCICNLKLFQSSEGN